MKKLITFENENPDESNVYEEAIHLQCDWWMEEENRGENVHHCPCMKW